MDNGIGYHTQKNKQGNNFKLNSYLILPNLMLVELSTMLDGHETCANGSIQIICRVRKKKSKQEGSESILRQYLLENGRSKKN